MLASLSITAAPVGRKCGSSTPQILARGEADSVWAAATAAGAAEDGTAVAAMVAGRRGGKTLTCASTARCAEDGPSIVGSRRGRAASNTEALRVDRSSSASSAVPLDGKGMKAAEAIHRRQMLGIVG